MKKNKRIVYVSGAGTDDSGYANWMEPDGFTDQIEEATFVLGLGGADVDSYYYNQPNSGRLQISQYTDTLEYADFKKAIKLGKPIVGICKSSQWGAAMAGGAIFQDVNHPSPHFITTFDGQKLLTNSSHHNMQDISKLTENVDYRLLAWAEHLSPYHINGWNKNVPCQKEPEVVFYPKINWLSIQPHPEWTYRKNGFEPSMAWYTNVLNKFLSKQL